MLNLTLGVRIISRSLVPLISHELSGVISDASVDGNEIPLIKVDAAVKQLVHLLLNKIVHLVFCIVEGTEFIAELVDQQVFQL